MSFKLVSTLLGPLVGHVTNNSARLWIKAEGSADFAFWGMAALFDVEGRYLQKSARYFNMNANNDFAGITEFSGLEEGNRYLARVGVLKGEVNTRMTSEAILALLPAPESWLDQLMNLPESVSLAHFRTFPESADGSLSFLLGSCRYPGLLWPSSRGDRMFASMHGLCETDADIRFVLMNGDQIYADKLPGWLPFCKAETPAAFRRRYQAAYSSPGMRELLRTVPIYMTLDDHEIENDWNSGRLEKKRNLFEVAIAAYRRYQWLHSPRNYSAEGAVQPGTGDQLFYSFECAGYPFFVIDSRSQRVQDDERCSLVANHMLGDPSPESPFHSRQLEFLCGWLKEQQQKHGNRPKFVVSPSTFAPNGIATAGTGERAQQAKCEDDAWAAFPATRRQLLQTIVHESIQNVVMLCGDAHSSCVAEIHFEDKQHGRMPLVMLSVTSSAFYWPWPFSSGNPAEFVHDSAKEEDGFEVSAEVTMHYRAYAFEQANNFTRINVAGNVMQIHHFNRDGMPLGKAIEFLLNPL